MFLYLYVDFFNLYEPGVLDGILDGRLAGSGGSTSARRC